MNQAAASSPLSSSSHMTHPKYRIDPPSVLSQTVSNADGATVALKHIAQQWCHRQECGKYTLVSEPDPPNRTCLLCVLTAYDAMVGELRQRTTMYVNSIDHLQNRLVDKEREVKELTDELAASEAFDMRTFLATAMKMMTVKGIAAIGTPLPDVTEKDSSQ